MGTPDFAVESLRQLVNSGIQVAAVITVPDRKAGRGLQLSESAVKQFAKSHNLPVLQPEKLKSDDFLNQLKAINADLFVVVAFRMLPEEVWDMPPLGTINLHASLLPQYRGAAPINWAVINGEAKSGATTFFIEKEIDTGKIIDRIEVPIDENDTAGNLHDSLMVKGAGLLVKTVKSIFDGSYTSHDQLENTKLPDLKSAPKIFKDDCRLNWNSDPKTLHNKIRGLSPYPTAWTVLISDTDKKSLKIFSATYESDGQDHTGTIATGETVKFGCNGGWIIPQDIQLEGKKRMNITDFIRGFDLSGYRLE